MSVYPVYIIAPIVGAIVIGALTSRRLAWRLLLLVPVVAQIVMYAYPSNEPHAFSIRRLVAEPEALVWLPITYLIGVVFFGTWAVIIGELGWAAVRLAGLPARFCMRAMLIAGLVAGALVGASFSIVTWAEAVLNFPNISVPRNSWAGGWLIASIIAGAFAGLLVAYYAATEPQHSGHEPSPLAQSKRP
jgi:hypothetical protein